jgi:glutathione S-transferase
MTGDRRITFHHAPDTRSGGTRILLEELGAEYDLRVLDFKGGEHRRPAYLAINPMGKVPAIRHGDALVTEQAAIFLYLAELHPEAGLSPPPGDPLRGPYLRWMVFYGSAFEPALVDRAAKREPVPQAMSPYGDYETVIATVRAQLQRGPWFLGERFTALDVLWAPALEWTMGFGIVEETPEFRALVDRVNARPAVIRAKAADAALAGRS